MRFEISDLLFAGFAKYALQSLKPEYGIEFFYEFGKDYYWDRMAADWGKRDLSIHGPCVAVNLADPADADYSAAFAQTLAYAAKIKASFVVAHTNEGWSGDRERTQRLVKSRLQEILALAERHNVAVLVENVGLRTKGNVLFDFDEYIALFDYLPTAGALLDTGHAHVNGWDLALAVQALGARLRACHIHDNSGAGDEHLPVGQGTINWPAYFAAIKKYAPQVTQVLEYSRGFTDANSLEEHILRLKQEYALQDAKED